MVFAALLLILTQAAPADSLTAVREAKTAQARFEYSRRSHLPITHGSGGRCDEQVGRFCYWYDESEPEPPHEPDVIARARRNLLDQLARLADSAPESGWIAGQRVRYLVEHGAADSALDVARACRARAWWCDALVGFSLHALGEFASADSAFRAALEGMDPAMRCDWLDLRPLLESELAEGYGRVPCAARDSANAAILWLARPRLAAPGNDLRTEHFARMTYVTALEDATTAHGRFGRDQREIVIRYGWERAWSRRPPRMGTTEDPAIVGFEARPAYAFLPVRASARELEWMPSRSRPRSRYAPAWARAVRTVPHLLLSRFERGDALLVIAAFEAGPDSLFRGDSVTAQLALSTGPGATPTIVGEPAPGGRGALAALATGDSVLVSLEITDRERDAVAVERALLFRSSDRARLSDLLLFEPQSVLPETPEQAAVTALASARFRRGTRIGLYWEVYQVPAQADSVTISVTVEEIGPGLITRIGRAIGLSRRPPPIRLGWQGAQVTGHAIELDLAKLEPGRYRLRVALEAEDQRWIEAERRFEIVD